MLMNCDEEKSLNRPDMQGQSLTISFGLSCYLVQILLSFYSHFCEQRNDDPFWRPIEEHAWRREDISCGFSL